MPVRDALKRECDKNTVSEKDHLLEKSLVRQIWVRNPQIARHTKVQLQAATGVQVGQRFFRVRGEHFIQSAHKIWPLGRRKAMIVAC